MPRLSLALPLGRRPCSESNSAETMIFNGGATIAQNGVLGLGGGSFAVAHHHPRRLQLDRRDNLLQFQRRRVRNVQPLLTGAVRLLLLPFDQRRDRQLTTASAALCSTTVTALTPAPFTISPAASSILSAINISPPEETVTATNNSTTSGTVQKCRHRLHHLRNLLSPTPVPGHHHRRRTWHRSNLITSAILPAIITPPPGRLFHLTRARIPKMVQ